MRDFVRIEILALAESIASSMGELRLYKRDSNIARYYQREARLIAERLADRGFTVTDAISP